jgi:hypothetical protein
LFLRLASRKGEGSETTELINNLSQSALGLPPSASNQILTFVVEVDPYFVNLGQNKFLPICCSALTLTCLISVFIFLTLDCGWTLLTSMFLIHILCCCAMSLTFVIPVVGSYALFTSTFIMPIGGCAPVFTFASQVVAARSLQYISIVITPAGCC